MFYIRKARPGLGHICSGTNAEILNRDGQIVGYLDPMIADTLLRTDPNFASSDQR